jgi:hypothetical protein
VKNIAVLAGNFSGNVGDLYILRSVTDFIGDEFPCLNIQVFPNPRRFDRRVACAEQVNLRANLDILPARYIPYQYFSHLVSSKGWLGRILTFLYLRPSGRYLRSRSLSASAHSFGAMVSVGGEMHTPHSFLDIHAYLDAEFLKSSPPLVYGPISVQPDEDSVVFFQRIFKNLKVVGVRDPKTFDWLRQQGILNTKLVPDCAYLSWRGVALDRGSRRRIGLCLHTSWFKNVSLACKIVDQACLVANRLDCELVVFPTHMLEDYQLFEILVKKYRDTSGMVFEFPVTSEDFIELSRSLKLVISDRLHALIVGMLHGANILPIKTRHKVLGYCEYLKLERAIAIGDGEELIGRYIEESALDEDLHAHLAKFCASSCDEVKAFYREQLGSLYGAN